MKNWLWFKLTEQRGEVGDGDDPPTTDPPVADPPAADPPADPPPPEYASTSDLIKSRSHSNR